MNGLKTILAKELTRVFKDKKMVFSMFILPIVMVIGIFLLIFLLIMAMLGDVKKHISDVYIQNAPKEYISMMEDDETSSIHYIDKNDDIETIKDDILKGNTDLLIVFPENFEQLVNAAVLKEIPQVKTFYNPSEDYSSEARDRFVTEYLENYRLSLIEQRYGSAEAAYIFTIDSDNQDNAIQDDDKATGKMLGAFIPYIITVMLFAGAMALGVDVITGEKERGTLKSLLLCPIKRSEIAFGKIIALAVLSLLSAAVYMIAMFGVFAIVKNLVKIDGETLGLTFSLNAVQIIEMIILILGIVLLYVAIIGLVAVKANTIKEATTYISPIYIVVMVIGLITMYSNKEASIGSYFIPLYNSSVTFKAIFTKEITVVKFLAAVISTYGCAALFTIFIAKAFKNEKTVFIN